MHVCDICKNVFTMSLPRVDMPLNGSAGECVCVCVGVCVRMYAYAYMYVCVCVHVCIYIYIYIYTYTYMHVCISISRLYYLISARGHASEWNGW